MGHFVGYRKYVFTSEEKRQFRERIEREKQDARSAFMKKWITVTRLKQDRNWTDKAISDFLGKPKISRDNRGNQYKIFAVEAVREAEKTKAFRDWMAKRVAQQVSKQRKTPKTMVKLVTHKSFKEVVKQLTKLFENHYKQAGFVAGFNELGEAVCSVDGSTPLPEFSLSTDSSNFEDWEPELTPTGKWTKKSKETFAGYVKFFITEAQFAEKPFQIIFPL